jgi:hypothetical protein
MQNGDQLQRPASDCAEEHSLRAIVSLYKYCKFNKMEWVFAIELRGECTVPRNSDHPFPIVAPDLLESLN